MRPTDKVPERGRGDATAVCAAALRAWGAAGTRGVRPSWPSRRAVTCLALVAALGALAGCRGVLGIDDLGEATGSSESETNEGGGGKAGAGGAPGKAGAGGGRPVDLAACQGACFRDASYRGVEAYYDAARACACRQDGDDVEPSCAQPCGRCVIEPYTFAFQSAACIACVAAKTSSGDCAGDVGECNKGDCLDFRQCIERCAGD